MAALLSPTSVHTTVNVQWPGTADSVAPHSGRLGHFQAQLRRLLEDDQQRQTPVFHHVDARLFVHLNQFLDRADTTPLFVRVTGASASGKTFYKNCWESILQTESVLQAQPNLVESIEQDSYYKPNDHLRAQMGVETFFQHYDLDHPDALDLHKAAQHLLRLEQGEVVHVPRYTWDGVSVDNAIAKYPSRIIFFEGLHVLHHPDIRELPGLNVFVKTPDETLQTRWTKRAKERDIPEAEQTIFYNRVLSRYREFVEPNQAHAHIILNGEATPTSIEQTLKVFSNLLLSLLDTSTPAFAESIIPL